MARILHEKLQGFVNKSTEILRFQFIPKLISTPSSLIIFLNHLIASGSPTVIRRSPGWGSSKIHVYTLYIIYNCDIFEAPAISSGFCFCSRRLCCLQGFSGLFFHILNPKSPCSWLSCFRFDVYKN